MISLDPPGRARRLSTIEASDKCFKVSAEKPKSRIILSPSKTPSLHSRPGDHDCFSVDMEKTAVKISLRFFFSGFRFALAYGWRCKTWRASTQANGDQCNCGPACQAAHAALTPNLRDNRLEIVVKKLEQKPIQEIEERDRCYFENRFSLSAEDKSDLQNSNNEIRNDRIQQVIKRLQSEELKSSFLNTSIPMIRNATFGNPSACNRIDSSLEKKLRPLEDSLAARCAAGEIRPREAFQELQTKYQELLKSLETRLQKVPEYLIALEDAYKQLIQAESDFLTEAKTCGIEIVPQRPRRASFLGQPENEENKRLQDTPFVMSLADLSSDQKTLLNSKISNFREKADAYCSCLANSSSKEKEEASPSSPANKEMSFISRLKTSLKKAQPPAILKNIFENLETETTLQKFQVYGSKLQINDNLTHEFQAPQTEIKCRIDEINAQILIVFKEFDTLYKLVKQELRLQKNSPDDFHTPTQQDIDKQFLSFLQKITPTRSDLQRPLKRKKLSKEAPDEAMVLEKKEETDPSPYLPSESFFADKKHPRSPPLTSREEPLLDSIENKTPNLEDSSISEASDLFTGELTDSFLNY